jgi:prepilin-type N-terminal cleavage/methylation domain-containing protein
MNNLRPAAESLGLAVSRRGFTLLEFVVAMLVFSVALSGLFPLLAILTRDLQPLRTPGAPGGYGCFTPARDGNTTGSNLVYQQHIWYLTPDPDPWVRKLGASATAACTAPSSGVSPIPIQSAVVFQYAYTPGGQTPQDGLGTFTCAGSWTYQPSGSGITSYYCDAAPVAPLTTTDSATWNLTVITAGWYAIQASWPAAFCATNPGTSLESVSYAVVNNGTPVAGSPFAVDQTQGAGTGISDGVSTWWNVTGPVYLQPGPVVVTLGVPSSPLSNCCVLADGIRIVRNDLHVVSLQRALVQMNGNSNGSDAEVNVSATVNLCK